MYNHWDVGLRILAIVFGSIGFLAYIEASGIGAKTCPSVASLCT